jgi:hypothetical protein
MPGSALRQKSFGCHPHVPTTPSWYHALHNGRSVGITPPGITPGTTGVDLNHAHQESRCPERTHSTTGLRTTPCTTGTPHNGRSYHTLHNGCLHAARLAQRAFRKRNSPHHIKTGVSITFPGRRTGWHSVAASALGDAPQKANDLAREAVNCNAGLGQFC